MNILCQAVSHSNIENRNILNADPFCIDSDYEQKCEFGLLKSVSEDFNVNNQSIPVKHPENEINLSKCYDQQLNISETSEIFDCLIVMASKLKQTLEVIGDAYNDKCRVTTSESLNENKFTLLSTPIEHLSDCPVVDGQAKEKELPHPYLKKEIERQLNNFYDDMITPFFNKIDMRCKEMEQNMQKLMIENVSKRNIINENKFDLENDKMEPHKENKKNSAHIEANQELKPEFGHEKSGGLPYGYVGNQSISEIHIKKLQRWYKKMNSSNFNNIQTKLSSIDRNLETTDEMIIKLNKQLTAIQKQMDSKIDTGILEEFARHVSTSQEVKKTCKSIEKAISVKMKIQMDSILLNVQKSMENATNESAKKNVTTDEKIKNEISSASHKLIKKLKNLEKSVKTNKVVQNEKSIKQLVQSYFSESLKQSSKFKEKERDVGEYIDNRNQEHQISRLEREFDDKLFTISTELSDCKTLFSRQVLQPFYRCAQWIWNSGNLRQGSSVPWNMGT
jgi:hypothetical protein